MKRTISIAIALSFIGSLFFTTPALAAGLTETQIQAIISLLQSFGADATTVSNVNASLRGSAPTSLPPASSTEGQCSYTWTRDLQLGSTGADVQALQQYLNAHGAVIALSGVGSVGNESTYFGAATKAALIKFQTAQSVSATGYFGAITRAKIVTLCGGSSTTSTQSSTSGAGGSFVDRAKGTVSSSETINVTSTGTATSTAPTCALSIGFAQTTTASGMSSNLVLTWSSRNTSEGTILPGIGAVATSGSATITPATTTLYVATFTGPSGAASCNATVNVN